MVMYEGGNKAANTTTISVRRISIISMPQLRNLPQLISAITMKRIVYAMIATVAGICASLMS
jgi:hypothetical protein